MGAYLDTPKTDKTSTDEENDILSVGASSMQGWRSSQEDAHNSILNFDVDTSFFAVYDGHGGAEIATYCSENLPNFLKELSTYKNGNFEQALKDAFLGFDQTILDQNVVDMLKVLAGKKNLNDSDDTDEEDDENLVQLREESTLPLDEVLEKYKAGGCVAGGNSAVAQEIQTPSMPVINKIKDLDPKPSGSKPQSPCLRGRRTNSSNPVSSLASNENTAESPASDTLPSTDNTATTSAATSSKMETDENEEDSTVSSSSSGKGNSINVNVIETVCEAEAESSRIKKITTNGELCSSPDSSLIKESEQNGVSCSEATKKSKRIEGVTSSSSTLASSALMPTEAKATVASKTNDSTVSGSNDLSSKQMNGEVSSPSATNPISGTATNSNSNISSSTGVKLVEKSSNLETLGDDDSSTDSDVDFQVDDNSSTDESDPKVLEYSSDEYIEDDDDDDDVDGDNDEYEDEEDAEAAKANELFCANMTDEPGKDSGCTAVIALLQGRDLYVANAGDSRCVICRNGKAIDLSIDHKPEDDEESERILKAGGRVSLDGRVCGGLNLSRAIGDHCYKLRADLPAEDQMISAMPDIKKIIISPEDEFLILACDGIWNFMSSDEVVNFIRIRLNNETERISKICEDLFMHCLAPNTSGDGTGCDNMTAVIIRFKPKILELPTKINPTETEDVLLKQKQIAEDDVDNGDANQQQSLKRSASPTSECGNEAEKITKRMKTDLLEESNEVTDVVASSSSSTSKITLMNTITECDSGSVASTNTATCSADASST